MACSLNHFAREELVLMTLFGSHAHVLVELDLTHFSKKKSHKLVD